MCKGEALSLLPRKFSSSHKLQLDNLLESLAPLLACYQPRTTLFSGRSPLFSGRSPHRHHCLSGVVLYVLRDKEPPAFLTLGWHSPSLGPVASRDDAPSDLAGGFAETEQRAAQAGLVAVSVQDYWGGRRAGVAGVRVCAARTLTPAGGPGRSGGEPGEAARGAAAPGWRVLCDAHRAERAAHPGGLEGTAPDALETLNPS